VPLPVNDELLADRYELAEVIGSGGMAEVYRAWDTRLRRPVAVKLFAPGVDLDNARRFDNEVRILAGLSHPGLVSVYDAGTSGRTPFVVLRLIEGRTLRQRMAEGPLPVEYVRSLGAAVADALAHVHDQGVTHRDVKPSNILLDDNDTPYLADFGLAHSIGSTRLTRTGLIVGTAAYLAPEQVRGAEVDVAADVYALGLVLLECLTGRSEYTGSDVEAIVSRLHRSPAIPAHLPADLAELLARMTSQSPDERPTAHDCADVLRTGRLTAVSTTRRAPKAGYKSSPRRMSLIASAAGLLGAVGIGWAMAPGPTAPVSEPPATARPAVVESTTATPDAAVQPVAAAGPVPEAAVEQPADALIHPVPVPVQEPAPEPGRAKSVGQQSSGHGEKAKHTPPGQAKKGKP
jgi:serine/threonine protein kinase